MKVLKNMEASKHKLQATSAHSQMHEAMLFFTPINLFLSACVCVCVCVWRCFCQEGFCVPCTLSSVCTW